MWNWKRCKAKIKGLKGRLGFPKGPALNFLKLSLNLEDGLISDDLANNSLQLGNQTLSDVYCILSSYADAEFIPKASELVTSKQLQGGRYCNVAVNRAKSSIQDIFGSRSQKLVESARLLGGSEVNFSYGDCSVSINSLPLIPLTIVLTEGDIEFDAAAQIFFDRSISNYLPLEQIGMLSTLTAKRLKQAHQYSDKKEE